ncbi:MAG: trigger factor [Planctomycetes bacterium]|nr:trigger factor [Planctomycetota bacterium]MBL7038388.1 trigger factor [Pirellulaceae bacterium]
MAESENNDVPETEAAEEQLAEQAEEVAEEQSVEQEEEQKEPLSLEVKIDKPGTCQRHVTVTVSREDIDRYMESQFDELAPDAEVPGFRPGRAPRKLVVNRFKDQVADQVKGKLLLDSIAQVSETDEFDFSPISEPDLDLGAIKMPDDGPLTFEFDVEVRPEFDLPQWKGLDLEEPAYEITDGDVDKHLEKVLTRYGELKLKDGPAEAGDYVTLNMTFTRDGEQFSKVEDETVPVKPKLSFGDAQLENFGELITGAKQGDTRETSIKISEEVKDEELKGKDIQATFEVLKVEQLKLPKLSSSFLSEIGDFTDEEDLRGEVRKELERQRRFRCQQHVRRQITKQLTTDADWELPDELLRKQAQRELRRMVLELEAAGFSDEVIQEHSNQLQRNSLAHTATALKEHFILERLADEEKIDVKEPEDYDAEIELIAEQEGIPPRRIRARLEKRGEMDALRNQIVERKVIEKIKAHATVKEVPFKPGTDDVTAVDHMVGGVKERAEIPEAKHADGGKPLPAQPDRG